jgi:hypothetical protein
MWQLMCEWENTHMDVGEKGCEAMGLCRCDEGLHRLYESREFLIYY